MGRAAGAPVGLWARARGLGSQEAPLNFFSLAALDMSDFVTGTAEAARGRASQDIPRGCEVLAEARRALDV